ncbi:MAG: prolyl oligopeptidase family serine peptidase [Candidatus Eremiobacteraeota bacterium]|nr:prolyl oligopeptidase family serine peptidase [Candidatus Eremiobacteraeota bacterium]MCW5872057.1 prolyl oligopeptidase family serine peptidase [Candidatus Eremiobacteraeota bacterium]
MKFLLLLFLALPLQAETLSLDQADGTRLYYYYDAPLEKGPLAVILQGSECRRVSDKYASFIERFNKANIGVLRVEKPGLVPDTPPGECPTAYLQRNTLERRIWDLLSVLGEMRKHPQWDGRLALVGGSEGAMLAALSAPLIPETRAVALISGGGGDTFAEEITQMMRAQGAPDGQLKQFQELCAQVHQEPTTTREWGSDGKMARNTHLWLSRAEDLAIYRPLLRAEAPILVVHGAADQSTPLHSAEKLQEIFQEAGHQNLQLRIEKEDGHSPSAQSMEATLEWVIDKLKNEASRSRAWP